MYGSEFDVRMDWSRYVPLGKPLIEVIGETVSFYELLYGLVERKAGTPLPVSASTPPALKRFPSERLIALLDRTTLRL